MAINKWLGTATAVAQVDTFTPATIEATDIFTLTVTGYDGTSDSISYTAVDTSADTVSDAIVTLWNAETGSLFTGITASGTSTVILTADTAGTGFKVASTTTDGGGADTQTFARVATTTNAGPNSWNTATNWSLGTVPGEDAGGDGTEEVYVEDSSVEILYGLDNSGATYYLKSLHATKTYTGKIGWNGSGGLVGDYLQIKTSKAFIGEFFESGRASGSGRIKIDYGDTAADIIVYDTASSSDTNKSAYRMLANSASTNVKEIRSGSASIAAGTGETSTIGDTLISYELSVGTDATLSIGSGVTMGDLKCLGGTTFLKSSADTIETRGGTLTISGSGTVTTMNAKGGKVIPVSSGTITTCNIDGATVDFTASAEARTVTTLTLSSGLLQYDRDVVTIASKVEPVTGTGRTQYRASTI